MKYKILLMGPQGCGKGTQAELLSDHLNIPAFGMGQLLRDEINSGSEIGLEAKAIVENGDLVPDDMAADVLKIRLARPDVEGGYILDGYPRNKEQFAVFTFDKPTHVVVIDIPKEESLKRLSGRLTCSSCGKIYAIRGGYKVGDKCECGSDLYQRDDDKPEAIKRRLEIYTEDTQPVIEEYKKHGVLYKIDGMGSVEEIYQRIIGVLKK